MNMEVKVESPADTLPSEYFYCILNNVPSTFHTSDLRHFFSVFIEEEKFDMFHFRHRPQIVNIVAPETETSGESERNSVKKCCCVVRFRDDLSRSQYIKRYHMKYWLDKEGNDLPSRCIIRNVNLSTDDLQRFNKKELHPPKFMPR